MKKIWEEKESVANRQNKMRRGKRKKLRRKRINRRRRRKRRWKKRGEAPTKPGKVGITLRKFRIVSVHL